MSEGAAGRRVIAARVCRRHPEALDLVARAELNLSTICELSPVLSLDNAAELFELCRRKTKREVEELLAARFPRPDVRDQVRRMPAPDPARGAPPRHHEVEALSPERYGIHFTADNELRELFERARDLASHRISGRDLASLMKCVFSDFVEREEQRRYGTSRRAKQPREVSASPPPSEVSQPATTTPPSGVSQATSSTPPGGVSQATSTAPPGGVSQAATAASDEIGPPKLKKALPRANSQKARSRHVAASVRRAVYERDGARCTFVAKDGRRCEATRLLQLDHVDPHGRGGPPTVTNLRLRCAAHNQLHARASYGDTKIDERIAQQRVHRVREVVRGAEGWERRAVARDHRSQINGGSSYLGESASATGLSNGARWSSVVMPRSRAS